MEHWNLVSSHKLCLTFQSKENGNIINLNKKWIKQHSDVNVQQIISFDNTDDGKLVFHTLES